MPIYFIDSRDHRHRVITKLNMVEKENRVATPGGPAKQCECTIWEEAGAWTRHVFRWWPWNDWIHCMALSFLLCSTNTLLPAHPNPNLHPTPSVPAYPILPSPNDLSLPPFPIPMTPHRAPSSTCSPIDTNLWLKLLLAPEFAPLTPRLSVADECEVSAITVADVCIYLLLEVYQNYSAR